MAYTTIDDPELYFQAKIYNGTGNSLALTFDGTNDMQPDWVWFKRRDGSANHHAYDSVRGVTKALVPNDTDSETGGSQEGTLYFSSFDSDGFTLAGNNYNNSNKSGQTYVAWSWKESNTTARFDIITYTGNATEGRTVSHSLGVVPKLMIVKNLDAAVKWAVYHGSNTANPETDHLQLQVNDATSDDNSTWNDTAPTSSVFSVGSSTSTNGNGTGYVAYLFADEKGYSKHGVYTGNGQASDGPFIYLGFKPAFMIIKCNSHADDWRLFDNKRSASGGNNPNDKHIYAHTSGAEAASSTNSVPDGVDFLSNGIKIRQATNGLNGNGRTYIFSAWAENPFVNSNGIPNAAE